MRQTITKTGSNTSQFKQKFLNRVVIGVSASKIYTTNGSGLSSSVDGGVTWTEPFLVQASGKFQLVHTTKDGIVLAFFNRPSKLFRSGDNGATWSEVSVLGTPWIAPFPNGISSNGNTIFFGEWTVSELPISRLFMSTDGGLTWSVKMTLQVPSEVRHWHTAQYLGEGIWLATTGDYVSPDHATAVGENQVRWYISHDDGVTFTEILGVDQRHRTLSVHLQGGDTLLWSSDGVPGKEYGAIYSASISSPLDVNVVFPLSKTSWGIDGDGINFIACTSLEPGDEDNYTYAYSSKDGGKTWHLESSCRAKPGDNFVGYRFPMGPDNFGNIYVQTNSLGIVGDTGWRATTIFNING